MNSYKFWIDLIPIINILITTATAFATIWYVRIASKTLREIKLQRETTYLPEIIINSTLFYLKCDKKYGFPIQFTLSSNISPSLINEIITFLTIPVRLYNIGLGSAKKIDFEFKFDVNKAISMLENKKLLLNDGHVHEFKFEYDNKSIMINGLNGQSFFSISQENKFYSYLLPVNAEKDGIELDFPIHISTMYAIYTFIWRLDHQLMKDCSFPPITIHLNYSDINNKHFHKIYQVNLIYRGGGASEIWNKLEVKELSIIN